MRLKRVKIFGFKTFADRTEFNIEGGLVAVVGPNGCGKSNLVDAILWGLGEANSRNLRAANSQDVIFSGSALRKSLGYAEVTLLFDNSDGSLPVPTSEVSITRRLTRGGDTEYTINRQPCRQRDIYELLADSGLGRSGYAIVGQKEIDQALSASAEERRAWVDEAAGVVRYRTRKQEAQRRLSSAMGHLERVQDILRELSEQREPLRAEAEIARTYKGLVESLRAIEQGLLVRELTQAIKEVDDLQVAIEKSTALAKKENEHTEALDVEIQAVGEAVSELEREMDALRNLQQSSLTAVEKALAEVRLGEERIRGLDQIEKALLDEATNTASQVEEANLDLASARGEEAREVAALAGLKEQLQYSDAELQNLRASLKAAEQELAEARQLHQRQVRQQTEIQHRKERVQLIRREIKGIESALEGLAKDAQEAEEERARFEAAVLASRKALQEAESVLVAARETEASEASETRKLLAERAGIDGRRRGIEATIETFEGLPQGPRAVMEAAKRGLLQGRFKPVGEAVSVGKGLALALEIALGGSANDLIVDDEADAKSAIAYLKENRLGRATFQPITLMRRSNVSPETRRLLSDPGVVGRASELAECAEENRPVIDSLLGHVLIVKDLDSALRLARTSGWGRLVTLDGEVLHHSGAVTGGRQSKGHYGLVQRQSDLRELESALSAIDKAILNAERGAEKRRLEVVAISEGLAGLRENVKVAQGELNESADLARTLRHEHEEAVRTHEKRLKEVAGLQQAAEEPLVEVDMDGAVERRDAAQALFARHADRAQESSARLLEAEGRARQAESRRVQAERRLSATGEAEGKRTARLLALAPEREGYQAEIVRQQELRVQAEERAQKTQVSLQELQVSKQFKLELSLGLAEEAKRARASAAGIGETLHQAELSRARADARRANAAQRLIEDYSIEESDALNLPPQIDLPADAVQQVSRLRRDIRNMGDVNVGAIDAFARLSERYDELSAQQDDILGGIAQVEEGIAQLDLLTRQRFLDTFEKLQATFSENFFKLFGAGSGSISLSNPDNVLDSGIDIEVTLPGKRQQPLALLSGGERSLCATAFLFGLLQIKSSPLVVLDEVDAPLDGRNVERFADLLVEFTDRIQFIVITHNHATIVKADTWLGVTMQELGVSTLVPAKISERPVVRAVVEVEAVALSLES